MLLYEIMILSIAIFSFIFGPSLIYAALETTSFDKQEIIIDANIISSFHHSHEIGNVQFSLEPGDGFCSEGVCGWLLETGDVFLEAKHLDGNPMKEYFFYRVTLFPHSNGWPEITDANFIWPPLEEGMYFECKNRGIQQVEIPPREARIYICGPYLDVLDGVPLTITDSNTPPDGIHTLQVQLFINPHGVEGNELEMIVDLVDASLNFGEVFYSPHGRLTMNMPIVDLSNDGEDAPCAIANAVLGTELAYQVQKLREFRDIHVLTTESGSAFMDTIHKYYYTFSPTVTKWEEESPLFKEIVKIGITPAIATFSLLTLTEPDSEIELFSYMLGTVLLNIGMYIGFPIIGIITIKNQFKNSRTKFN